MAEPESPAQPPAADAEAAAQEEQAAADELAGKAQIKWSNEEDQALRDAVGRHGPKSWKKVAGDVLSRTSVQCLQRWNKVLKPGLVKGTWQQKEDELLMSAVGAQRVNNETVNWSKVSQLVMGRTPKQCRERWRCNLDPDIVRTNWSPAEDELIHSLQREMGNKWAMFALRLPGRTENAIKTRWRTLERQSKSLIQPDSAAAAAVPKRKSNKPPRPSKRPKKDPQLANDVAAEAGPEVPQQQAHANQAHLAHLAQQLEAPKTALEDLMFSGPESAVDF